LCIIIVKTEYSKLDLNILKKSWNINNAGAGFAYIHNNELILENNLFTFDEFYRKYISNNVDNKKSIIHFRNPTRGDKNNTQPINIGTGVLAHNGTIKDLGVPNIGKSDSKLFAEMVYNYTNDEIKLKQKELEKYINIGRIVFLMNNGELIFLNKDLWIIKDGVYFSNDKIFNKKILSLKEWIEQKII